MGDVDAARVVVREFQELGRSAAFPVAELVATEASLLALEGRRAEAVEQYRDAFRRYRDLKLSFDGAVIGLDAAKALGVDTPEGASAAAEAREVFERLGAQPFLEIMDRLAVDAAVPTRRVGSRAAEAARP
jgi:hypothetical protein